MRGIFFIHLEKFFFYIIMYIRGVGEKVPQPKKMLSNS